MMHKVNQSTYAKLFKAWLDDAVLSVADASELTGLHALTTQHLFKCFREQKIIHIAEWRRGANGRYNTPAYALGDKPHAKRPTLTRYDIVKRYRAKQKGIQFANLLRGAA